ncbi:MAG: DnaD domain protein [Bacilli bacterium]
MGKISVLPLDSFVVLNKALLNSQDRLTLTVLYQPIIGSIAISLYLTLWSYLDNDISSLNDHYALISSMQMKLEDIIEAREKLEAIGLIKTYLKKDEINNYVYELYNPLSAYEFLNNPILNMALYNNISKKEYKRISKLFSFNKIDLKDYEDITTSFKDLYNFVGSSKIDNTNIKKANHLGLSFEPTINFNELLSLIPEELLNCKSICKQTRELIYQLAFIYNLNNDDMSDIIKNSTEDRKINVNLLKENCRNFYCFENKGKIPRIVFQNQPLSLRQENMQNTKRSKLINQFETTTPYEFLTLKQGGSKPPKNDLQIIEYLMVDQGLNSGVVNVLIDYVLKINNNKLIRPFVEQIASQWKKSNILTVSDALDIAKIEYEKRTIRKTSKKVIEQVPTWFDKNIDDEIMNDEQLKAFENELKGVIR